MRAAVFSGGGEKIQFHVGWCKRRIGELGTHYDILSGVSAGAFVAGFLAQFAEGQESAAAKALVEEVGPIANDDVWKHWFLFHEVAGLWKPALRNSKPLHETVRRMLDPKAVKTSKRLLRVGAVNLSKGEYEVLTEDAVPLADALLASGAFPGFLLPVKMQGDWWTDGGVQVVTPVKSAIDAGATEIDVVVTAPEKAVPRFEKEPSAIDVMLRSLELMMHRLTWIDVRHAMVINDLVLAGKAEGKRYVDITISAPQKPLPTDVLQFDPAKAPELQLIGYNAAVDLEEDTTPVERP